MQDSPNDGEEIPASVEVRDVSKEYGDLLAVDNVSLRIRESEILCLLGPSGCGKSTTLRIVSGLEQPTSGGVYFKGQDVTETQPNLRDSAMVFQSWALFSHKSVLDNVAFGLKMKGVNETERHQRAKELLELVHLSKFSESEPDQLSGGQKQRVALARSLAVNPEILLLDEPLSNLDKKLREQMQVQLKDIHDDIEQTMLYVTHDQAEAFTLADRIGIMNEGRLVQIGEPMEVYNNPKNKFVEDFLGETNFVSATITNKSASSITVSSEMDVEITLDINPDAKVDRGNSIDLSIRPEVLQLSDRSTSLKSNEAHTVSFEATVDDYLYRGATIRYNLKAGDAHLFYEENIHGKERLDTGSKLTVTVPVNELYAFSENERRIA